MNRTQLPIPPDPSAPVYAGNPIAWQKATFAWMQQVKQQVETDSAVNTTPVGPLVVSTYTAVSTITGTDSLSNFVATFVTYLQAKGVTAPNVQRTTT